MHSVGEPRRGSGELRTGACRACGRTLHNILGDATARRCDVPHSQLPSCECAKGAEGGAKDDDEFAGSSSQLQHGRADRIHVTLAKDLRQALSYLTRLTYYL